MNISRPVKYKNIVFGIICVFLAFKSRAQKDSERTLNTKEYYRHIHEAEMLSYLKDSVGCILHYDTAFRIQLPFLKDLNEALDIVNSCYVFDPVKINHFKLEWKSIHEHFYSDSIYSAAHFKNTQANCASYHWLNEVLFDQAISRKSLAWEIIQMHASDQALRRQKISGDHDSLLKISSISQFRALEKWILANGWPNAKFDGRLQVLIYPILLHGSYFCGISEQMNAIMIEAINDGVLNNHFYAKLIDRYYNWVLEQPQYFGEWFTTLNGQVEIREIENLNSRRAVIFLETYEEFYLKFNPPYTGELLKH